MLDKFKKKLKKQGIDQEKLQRIQQKIDQILNEENVYLEIVSNPNYQLVIKEKN